jgi:hypothetical protein
LVQPRRPGPAGGLRAPAWGVVVVLASLLLAFSFL